MQLPSTTYLPTCEGLGIGQQATIRIVVFHGLVIMNETVIAFDILHVSLYFSQDRVEGLLDRPRRVVFLFGNQLRFRLPG